MKQTNDYILEILERVKGLEVTLRNYEEIEDDAEEAKLLASRAREEIKNLREKLESEEFKNDNKRIWTKRTFIAALTSMTLVLIGNIIFTLLKLKFGW